MFDVLGDRLVRELGHEVRLPVRLQAGGIERIERALDSRERHGADSVQRGLLLTDGPEDLVSLLGGPGIAPDDGAHLLQVELFGERRARRNGQEGEEAVQVVRCCRDEVAVPTHDLGRAFERP